MWEFETEVSDVIPRTPSIRTFRFPIRSRNVRYRPGQFFYVTIKVGDGEGLHHFTISNSPTEKGYLEFTKRITESSYSQALAQMRPGDWARLSGPEGKFTLPAKPRKLAFLAGGIGITPVRSMLRYIADRQLPFDVVLLYGNRSWDEVAFRDEFGELTRRLPHFRVEHVLLEPHTGWSGHTGHVNANLVQQVMPDLRERLCYVSGPPSMVRSMERQLFALGMPQDQVKRDPFSGYD
ncbi:MAG: FAD-binding oxidoreductase [Chloroflexi bacterium]|nr:FAD-binding oxidoreductase [Chloroflexota bacterium]